MIADAGDHPAARRRSSTGRSATCGCSSMPTSPRPSRSHRAERAGRGADPPWPALFLQHAGRRGARSGGRMARCCARRRRRGSPPGRSGPSLWFGISALAMLPFAWAFARRLTRPIRRFADAVERLDHDQRRAAGAGRGAGRTAAHRAGAQCDARAAARHDARAHRDDRRDRARSAHAARAHRLPHRGARPTTIAWPVQADIEQMREMVAATIGFLRGDAGVGERRPVDLAAIARRLAGQARDTGSAVAIAEIERAMVSGDRSALERLIQNLIDNAVKYAGGAELLVRHEVDRARLTVADRGPGIPEARARSHVRAVRAARALAQPLDRRARARPRHRAQHRAGAWRHDQRAEPRRRRAGGDGGPAAGGVTSRDRRLRRPWPERGERRLTPPTSDAGRGSPRRSAISARPPQTSASGPSRSPALRPTSTPIVAIDGRHQPDHDAGRDDSRCRAPRG